MNDNKACLQFVANGYTYINGQFNVGNVDVGRGETLRLNVRRDAI